jgi:DNA-binding MarR family transcriptional regulator
MEHEVTQIAERLEAATALLERTLNWLEERGASVSAMTGEVDKISATVEAAAATRELAEKLAAAEREIEQLKIQASAQAAAPQVPLRRTMPAATSEMLAKHGIADGPVDVRTLDAALAGLSLEQRIAVKSQLLRAGAIA